MAIATPDIWLMLNDVKAWLTIKPYDYDKGLEIVQKYGDGGFLLSLLKSGDNTFNRHKMLEEIIRIRTGETGPDAI